MCYITPTMKYKLHTHKNGFRTLLVPQSEATTATVMVLTGTGSRNECTGNNGISHFLEHMLFKGTERRPTPEVLANELDGLGSEHNAFTSKDHTAYYAKVSNEHISHALDIIADIFLNAKIDARELNKERGAIIEEINMYEDIPMRSIQDEFESLLFGKHTALGCTVLGPKENIRTLKRKDLQEYIKTNYTPSNSVVCIVGKFNESGVIKEVNKHFKEFVDLSTKQPPFEPCLDAKQTNAGLTIKQKNTDQTHLVLGFSSYEYKHKDEYALHILNTILGSGMSSRLFMEVREKRGLAYYVGSFVEFFADTGYIAARAGVTHANLERAVKVILKEMTKLKTKTVTQKELKKAKNQLKGSLALSLDTTDAIANYFATNTVLRGKAELPSSIAKKIDKVTAADVKRVARDIFQTTKLNLAIVGPHRNKAELLKVLRV